MSLINDALKRAKQVQQQAPPRPRAGPEPRPVAGTPALPGTPRWIRLGLPAAAGLLACLLIWNGIRTHGPVPVAAAGTRPTTPALSSPPPKLDPPAPAPTPAEPAAPAGESGLVPSTNAPAAGIADAPAPGQATNSPAASVSAPEPPPAGPASLRLQAIVFHPTRPSAIISGKTLFVGDTLGEMHLVAITRGTATLVGGGQTNLLTLR